MKVTRADLQAAFDELRAVVEEYTWQMQDSHAAAEVTILQARVQRLQLARRVIGLELDWMDASGGTTFPLEQKSGDTDGR